MVRATKSKRFNSYEEIRKRLLLEDNIKEEKVIKQLTKRLKIKKRGSVDPLWIRQCGFDYLLDFDKYLRDSASTSESGRVLGDAAKKKTFVDLYGQAQGSTTNGSDSEGMKKKQGLSSTESDLPFATDSPGNVAKATELSSSEDFMQLRRTIRSWFNRLSEAHMQRAIVELTGLFSEHPRAIVRAVLIEELAIRLETSPVGSRSNIGWLHQELAVCIGCIHANLHISSQHDDLVAHLTECLIDKLFPEHNLSNSKSDVCSISLFLAYLFRFGVLSHVLIFDVLREFLQSADFTCTKSAHFVCTAVGVYLRKADLSSSRELIDLATKRLISLNAQHMDEICELEGFIQRLSEKHSKEECVVRATRLKKTMHLWIKGGTFSEDMCLSVSLEDFRCRESKGRWWLVGSARRNEPGCSGPVVLHDSGADQLKLSPDVEAAADTLGFKTTTRRSLLNILLSTPGGPEATANALITACHGGPREREMVQIVLHCLMAEEPFNRFYARVLGGLLSSQRKFLMMVKCAFWDVMKRSDLSVNAKSNAGRALGLLASVYDLPLTVLKNFNFGDTSDSNTSFLRHVLVELCTGDYHKVLTKLWQLNCYTRLCRNCRIFMRKHFGSESDENLKAFVMKLISDLREAELT